MNCNPYPFVRLAVAMLRQRDVFPDGVRQHDQLQRTRCPRTNQHQIQALRMLNRIEAHTRRSPSEPHTLVSSSNGCVACAFCSVCGPENCAAYAVLTASSYGSTRT